MERTTNNTAEIRQSPFARLRNWFWRILGRNAAPQSLGESDERRIADWVKAEPTISTRSAVPPVVARMRPLPVPSPTLPAPSIASSGEPATTTQALVVAHSFAIDGDTVFLDTETTGLTGDVRIVEIAIVDGFGNALMNTLVNPQIPIPTAATAVHHIFDADVASAPPLHELMPRIREIISGKRVVIYNSSYDQRLFPGQLAEASSVECAMKRFKKLPLAIGNGNGTLMRAAAWADHTWSGTPHRALADARAAATVWNKLEALGIPFGLSGSGGVGQPRNGNRPTRKAREPRAAGPQASATIAAAPSLPKPARAASVAALQVSCASPELFDGKSVSFTGTLPIMTRKAAKELVLQLGGVVGKPISAKTDYLVVGVLASDKDTRKKRVAEELIAADKALRILSPEEFFAMAGVSPKQS